MFFCLHAHVKWCDLFYLIKLLLKNGCFIATQCLLKSIVGNIYTQTESGG